MAEVALSKLHLKWALDHLYPHLRVEQVETMYFFEGLLYLRYQEEQGPVYEDMGGLV